MRSPRARDIDLAASFGLTLGRLRKVLSGVHPVRRVGDTCWYRWRDLAPAVESEAMWKARRQAREQLRRRLGGSRYWVDGFAHLVSQWHSRNSLLPYEVSRGSHLKAWWKCKAGRDHEWRADVSNRVAGAGCPFCTNRRVSVTNSLATCHPNIAAQWHPTKNGTLGPADVLRSSGIRVWWQCPKAPDHVWHVSVHARTQGRDRLCPFCTGNKVSRTNSLAAREPDLAREWAHRLNGRLTPADVTAGSNRVVWWRCSRQTDHLWKAQISNRSLSRSGCPFCAKRAVPVPTSLATVAPLAARLWDPTKNGTRRPENINPSSRKLAWWRCPQGHSWNTYIRTVARDPACPRCAERTS